MLTLDRIEESFHGSCPGDREQVVRILIQERSAKIDGKTRLGVVDDVIFLVKGYLRHHPSLIYQDRHYLGSLIVVAVLRVSPGVDHHEKKLRGTFHAQIKGRRPDLLTRTLY